MIGRLALRDREVDDRAEHSDPSGSERSDTDTEPQSSRCTAPQHARHTSRERHPRTTRGTTPTASADKPRSVMDLLGIISDPRETFPPLATINEMLRATAHTARADRSRRLLLASHADQLRGAAATGREGAIAARLPTQNRIVREAAPSINHPSPTIFVSPEAAEEPLGPQ